MRQFVIEGINIYTGEVDWTTTLEALDEVVACRAARVVCVGEMGVEPAGIVDLRAYETIPTGGS